ncbi:TetR/AcrR family transcriptional regulator [Shewanella psychropiezotolerans]|uniref:TetR/AcrR family transcriptional regulator n=1 Tax=Shewanella psychropiezotolerans TaxID=2593655 RepID=A0ABX5WXX3_9GAMM|nr:MULTISPECIES: TetR/AcrR family transcriptional regulator [Shewanella]MPY24629.1 TetR/AcrR family transcriptional regulator [Shewanella sp. YLB-07]QDO83950.1 TetR/AcrR family transcriptional regulator [Shewanella psychropiezotolerans]
MPRKIDENKLFGIVVNEWLTIGYAATTTKAIASIAGVNEATLFRRYGNKAVLFARAIDHQLINTPLSLVQISDDLHDDLVALVKSYIVTFDIYGDIVFRLLHEISGNPDIRDATMNLINNLQGMVKMIKHHQDQNALRSEYPMLTLTALLGPIATYMLFSRTGLNPELPKFNAQAHVTSFLYGRSIVPSL